jgi:hypothetical protein
MREKKWEIRVDKTPGSLCKKKKKLNCVRMGDIECEMNGLWLQAHETETT